jgi:predicted nucleic acid-binding protein
VERLKYLVDSNIWLELLLNQQKAAVVQCFFQTNPTGQLAISEFTVCSIGLILSRLDKPDVWRDFVTIVVLTLLRENIADGAPAARHAAV